MITEDRLHSNHLAWAHGRNRQSHSAVMALLGIAGLGVLTVPLAIYIFTSLYLLLGQSLTAVSAQVIVLASIVLASSVVFALAPAPRSAAVAAVLAIVLLLPLLAGLINDTTLDGQEYHFQAVHAIAAGWNPYYERVTFPEVIRAFEPTIWITHYPKSSWMVMATSVAAGLSSESAKYIGLAFAVAAGALSASLLFRIGLPVIPSLLAGLVAAANPIAFAQLLTRMNDGVLGQCMLLFIVLICFWLVYKEKWALFAALLLMAFSLNLKFSAVPYFVALSALATLAAGWFFGVRAGFHVACVLLAGGIVSMFLLGSAPYLQNVWHHGHPFYPVMGSDAVDIMAINTPAFLEESSRPAAFLFSLFAETHSGFATLPSLKIPFSFTPEEVRFSGGPDARIGGFGPLFSGAIVLAALTAVSMLARKSLSRTSVFALVAAAVVIVVSMIFPESWWARYVPQLWLAPVAVAVAALVSQSRLSRGLAYGILGVMAVNSMLVLASSVYLAQKRHSAVYEQIERMAADPNDWRVYFGQAQSRLLLMRDANVRVTPSGVPLAQSCERVQELASYGPDRHGGEVCRSSELLAH